MRSACAGTAHGVLPLPLLNLCPAYTHSSSSCSRKSDVCMCLPVRGWLASVAEEGCWVELWSCVCVEVGVAPSLCVSVCVCVCGRWWWGRAPACTRGARWAGALVCAFVSRVPANHRCSGSAGGWTIGEREKRSGRGRVDSVCVCASAGTGTGSCCCHRRASVSLRVGQEALSPRARSLCSPLQLRPRTARVSPRASATVDRPPPSGRHVRAATARHPSLPHSASH